MERYSEELEEKGDLDTLVLNKIALNQTEDYKEEQIVRLMTLAGVYEKNERQIEELSAIEVEEELKVDAFMENLKQF